MFAIDVDMDSRRRVLLYLYLPFIYVFTYCIIAFEVNNVFFVITQSQIPMLFYIDYYAIFNGYTSPTWREYPQFNGHKTDMSHAQALMHITGRIIIYILITTELASCRENNERMTIYAFVSTWWKSYDLIIDGEILQVLIWTYIVFKLQATQPHGRYVYHFLLCRGFLWGSYYFISYIWSIISYYYIMLNFIHNGIHYNGIYYNQLMKNGDNLIPLFFPLMVLFIMLLIRLYNTYTYRQQYEQEYESED